MLMFASTHYIDAIMSAMVSQNIGVSIFCSHICSGANQWKHQSPASLDFVEEIHRSPVVDSLTEGNNEENDSIWLRHHVKIIIICLFSYVLLAVLFIQKVFMHQDKWVS